MAPMLLAMAYFYPRPPRGGRQNAAEVRRLFTEFLSTPSARRATSVQRVRYSSSRISIHALREEGDVLPDGWEVDDPYFYPRPPRGGRPAQLKKRQTVREFLSTPSARRATREEEYDTMNIKFLSTPSARRATTIRPAY